MVSEFLDQFVIYNFEAYGVAKIVKAYKMLKTKGKMVNELDIIIGGIPAANNEMLISRDRDFSNFEIATIIVLSYLSCFCLGCFFTYSTFGVRYKLSDLFNRGFSSFFSLFLC